MTLLILLPLMFATILGDAAADIAYATVPLFDETVVGGSAVAIENYPYQVSVQLLKTHVCGGAIISDRYIVSAAHCFILFPTSWYTIRAGSSIHNFGGQVVKVNTIHRHVNYNPVNLDFDICILDLASFLSFGPNTAPISLPAQNQYYPDDTPAVVTGWGGLIENGAAYIQLQAVWVPIVSNARCKAQYDVTQQAITNSMLCAGYIDGSRDACQGDPGGPLVIDGQLMGVVSWGEACGGAKFPGVYANVSYLRSFITDITKI
ncbi:polyserase-related [Holotrichia oblita]|uniref:Polyserase-related n=1 Tax=Holotrichia oblita TaxID=644536 RepID=A0ACB9SYN0_HOLOL|nr:polyserase-related [Holotrichia oblita]